LSSFAISLICIYSNLRFFSKLKPPIKVFPPKNLSVQYLLSQVGHLGSKFSISSITCFRISGFCNLPINLFIPPSNIEIQEIIEKNRKKKERVTFIEANKDDPEKAAKKKADEILSIAQEKYKSIEIEAETLKIKAENEIRQTLTDEFDLKLNEAVKKVSQD